MTQRAVSCGTSARSRDCRRAAAGRGRPSTGRHRVARKIVITCALTGSFDTPSKNPAVPVTPQQIAQSALDAASAGAAVVHIHVRDPKTTKPSMDLALYRETVERIRERNGEVIINLTTGAGGRFVPGE